MASGNLFSALEGELSSEQYTEVRKLRKEAGDLVVHSDDEDEYICYVEESSVRYEPVDPMDVGGATGQPEEGATILPTVGEELGTPTASTPTTTAITTTTQSAFSWSGVDNEITIKYLQGKLSFEEFDAMLEKAREERRKEDETEADQTEAEAEETDDILEPSTSTNNEEPAEAKVDEQPKIKRTRKRRPHARLAKDLQGLMGEANLKFARGQHEEAVKMCMEVIRLAPTAPEPFQTLGLLYEEMGDMEKALQFSLIAAHLSPNDSEEWVRLAEMSLELTYTDKAIMCYTKAIRYDPKNYVYVWERCNLYETVGENKKAMEGYQQILKLLPEHEVDKYFQLARDITKNYHESNETDKAVETMNTTFKVHPKHITSEDVNLLVELLIGGNKHERALEVLFQHCGVELRLSKGEKIEAAEAVKSLATVERGVKRGSIFVPDELPIDLRIKLVVCLIHCRYKKLADPVVCLLFDESPEDMGDLYLDVAEAYMEKGDYTQAKPILSALVASYQYNLAAVWLRYGECLNALGELQNAVQAYKHVVELAPNHLGARVSLSALQQQLGKHDDALRTLTQGEEESTSTPTTQDLRLLLHRCLLLYSQGKYLQFFDCSKTLLFSQFKGLFRREHMNVILGNRSLKHRSQALRAVIGTEFENTIKALPMTTSGEHGVTVDDIWDLYLKVCQTLVDLKMFAELEEFSIIALTVPQFMTDTNKAQEADFICLTACLMNGNGHFAYNFVKELCVKHLESNRIWNLFVQVINTSQDLRHNRFCLRLMIKNPDHLPLGLLNGHNSMVAGSYKHSLGEYVAALKQVPNDPLVSLCIGINFIHMASQKYAAKRHALIIQGCSFFNRYLELRGECQEAYYNIGRAMHQIGLLHAAIYYYEKALELPPAIPTEKGEVIFDLQREAAYNLSCIYLNSGSKDLARMVLQQHCVI